MTSGIFRFTGVITLGLLLLAFPVTPVRAQSVGGPSVKCLGKISTLILTPMTWDDASKLAASAGQRLVIIKSAAQNDCLAGFVASQSSAIKGVSSALSSGGGVHYVWLGATDDVSEGAWKWVDGQPISSSSYTKWGSGPLGTEPDNSGNQDYLAMAVDAWPKGPAPGQGIGRAGEWNDITGTALNTFLMESPDSTELLNGDNYFVVPKVFTGESGNTSYFRFQNIGAVKRTAEIKVVGSQTGRVYGVAKYEADPLTAKQYLFAQVFTDAGIPPFSSTVIPLDYSYQLYIPKTESLLFSHVIYNGKSAFFENISICKYRSGSDYSAAKNVLWNFHTSLFSDNYPAVITLANTNHTSRLLQMKAYDALTGVQVGSTKENVAIAANSVLSLPISAVEKYLDFTPSKLQYHINIVVSEKPAGTGQYVPFTGVIEYLVINNTLFTSVNMEQVCPTW